MRQLIFIVAVLAISAAGAFAQTASELLSKAEQEPNNAVRARVLDEAAARVDAGDTATGISAPVFRAEAEAWREGVRQAGDFTLFRTDGDKFIAGQYWLAPDVRLIFSGSKLAVFVDRGFMPRRMIRLADQTDWTYQPEIALPLFYRAGDALSTMLAANQMTGEGVKTESHGAARFVFEQRREANLSLRSTFPYRFTLDAEPELRSLLMSSGLFEFDGQAAYVPQWDAMFDAATFARIRVVIEGTALNWAIFNTFATLDVSPSQLVRCFMSVPREKLQADAAKIRREHDDRAAELFRTGNPAFSLFWDNGQAIRDYQSELLNIVIPCLPN